MRCQACGTDNPAAAKFCGECGARLARRSIETVRSLIDQQVVEGTADGYRLVGDVAGLPVPDSLHGLLAARLDALPAEVRALVADASVVGSSFPKEALMAVSGRDEEAVTSGLGELVRRDELLSSVGARLFPLAGLFLDRSPLARICFVRRGST